MESSNDIGAEFLQPDFDVEAFARQLVDKNVSVAEELASLASATAQLEKQLKEQIATHHENLLSQATGIELLEDGLATISQHVAGLQISVNRSCDRLNELFKQTDTRTRQLERLHETCTLLRTMIRVWQLSSRLASSKDLVKSSQASQELRELIEEVDLRNINVVEQEVSAATKQFNDLVARARQTLRHGMEARNHSEVASAIQALLCTRQLDAQLAKLTVSMVDDAKQSLESFGRLDVNGADGDGVDDNVLARRAGAPGGASLSPAPVSVMIRANLWNDMGRFIDLLLSYHAQLNVLQTVITRKRDQSTHRPLNELIDENFFVGFWTSIAENVLRRRLCGSESEPMLRQSLETEYPRLIRSMTDVFRRLDSSDDGRQSPGHGAIVRNALQPLETAYLAKSLSRLFDTVHLAFSTGDDPNTTSPVGASEIETVIQAIATELNASSFDEQLFDAVCRNVGKVVRLFGVKCEQLMCTDGEASQVISHPSPGQRRNVDIVGALDRFSGHLQKLYERLSVNNKRLQMPAPVSEASTGLRQLMICAVKPLLDSIGDAISAIITTIHQEDFGQPAAQATTGQCSLYMRELQEFISRVWREFLSPYECSGFIYEQTTEIASAACSLFVLHASLVRPLGEGGRLRLAADFAQMELAVTPLCQRLSDMGDVYGWLRALRPLMFKTPAEIADCVSQAGVPYSVVIHLLISQSPDELQSPHVTAGWSLTRYIEWLRDHQNELDRLQFLRGCLETYARMVQTEGRVEYVATYPQILKLLQTAFDKASVR